LAQLGQTIEKLLIDLQASGAGGQPDQVKIEGAGVLDAETGLALTADVPSLRLDPYLAAASYFGGAAEASPTPAPAPAKPSPPPALKAAIDWTVGDLSLRGGTLTNAKGRANFDKGVVDAVVEEGTLAQGILTAEAGYDMTTPLPAYRWKANLEGAKMDELLAFSSADLATKMTGTGTFQSQGTGRGLGEDLLKNLDSQSTAKVVDGELRGLKWLDSLSEFSRSDSFRNFKFFEVVGAVDFKDGKGSIHDTAMRGPQNKIAVDGIIQPDMSYAIDILPFLKQELVKGGSAQEYANLLGDGEGYVKLPLKVVIQGKGPEYSTRPVTQLPIGGAGQSLDQTVRGAIGGLLQREIDKNTKPEATPAPTDTATTATTTTEGAAAIAPTPKPEPTKKPSTEDQVIDALGGLLGGRLGR
jgi:hypothetical protein